MKRRVINWIAAIALIAGLSLILYPTVSNYFNRSRQRTAILNYLANVEEQSEEDYTELIEAAQAYNAEIAKHPDELMNLSEEQRKQYDKLLDVTGTGIMGYIEIDKADIFLPIYHGTSEPVLQAGVGHIEGSSLPIGGESTHALLSGHRGLPSALLFTNLDQLEVGDRFVIRVLDSACVYEIYNIETVEPTEISSLHIEPGKDLCTLITCTPYGINTHRLLLHGRRVDIPIEQERISIQSGARRASVLPLMIIFEAIAIAVTVFIQIRRRK